MIGKPQWFKRRKYGGWGLYPATWQGWVYIAVLIAPAIAISYIPGLTETVRTYASTAWVVVILFDVVHIMVGVKNDERETKIEALAERNASWAMVTMIALGIVYQVVQSGMSGDVQIDWFLLATLGAGVVVKAISNIVYERKNL